MIWTSKYQDVSYTPSNTLTCTALIGSQYTWTDTSPLKDLYQFLQRKYTHQYAFPGFLNIVFPVNIRLYDIEILPFQISYSISGYYHFLF